MTVSVQRVTLVTLGVADLYRARVFYSSLGWKPAVETDGVSFYQMNGQALGLFGLTDLAADQGRPEAALGTGAVTLAQNFATPAEVDSAYFSAILAGATPLKPPEKVFWGGYSGYFSDPDGHVWELAHNPFWPLRADGSLTLPGGIEAVAEMDLSSGDEAQIVALLARAFDTDFGGRSYHKTRHHLRLVIRESGTIIAHVALQFRAMRLGGRPGGRLVTVAGLAEVATDPGHRGKGHAAALLQRAIRRARAARADYMLLFGNARLYGAAGFRTVHNPMRFLELEGAASGAMKHQSAKMLMVLPLGFAPWDDTAELDLLGGLF